MILVLDTDAATSEVFGVTWRDWGFFLKTAGGVWKLQAQDPDGDWHDMIDGAYTDTGAYKYPGFSGLQMRFTGGTVGAKIWIVDAYDG